MAPLPKPFSRAAFAIESAIAEGRAEEALHKLVHALRADGDSKSIRFLAAAWIENIGLPPGAAKALRKGNKALPEDWLNISEMVGKLQEAGKTRDAAIMETAAYFGCSDRHVEKCVADWNKVERTRWED
jgi:predicted Zn-dependent protease